MIFTFLFFEIEFYKIYNFFSLSANKRFFFTLFAPFIRLLQYMTIIKLILFNLNLIKYFLWYI